MKQKLYNFLVNKQAGIQYRYHNVHDNTFGFKKVLSWIYLLWLNFSYYVLCIRRIGRMPEADIYETKSLIVNSSESVANVDENNVSVDNYLSTLKSYDVISFDVFDTLIFRPLSCPVDAFYFMGDKLGISDFRNIRMLAEWQEREKCKAEKGHTEISLRDIWRNLSGTLGCSFDKGIFTEIEVEKSLCFANPFMLSIWNKLLELDKKIVITSDMYLPKDVIKSIVESAGFVGASEYYISCDFGKNKASGTLYEEVKQDNKDKRIIHVGDNEISDVKMAKKAGVDALHYPSVNSKTMLYRPFDMSYIVGSAYRGIINNRIYNCLNKYSMEYEYGFIYGGLFVVGYCNFIHDYCLKNGVEKVLFLARDGDILSQAYNLMFSDLPTEYVYWSRKCATKLMASNDKRDFFRRFIYHKQNQGYRLSEILDSMELSSLKNEFSNIDFDEVLTDKNANKLKEFIESKWDKVELVYSAQHEAAKAYYSTVVEGYEKVAAVDIGWAGSGALSLSYLMNNVWDLDCELIGILAGTNTIYNAEPDASESFLQSGKLVSYLYSSAFNRDLLKKHNPNKDYNVFWELLLSSPESSFNGFDMVDGKVELNFGDCDANIEGIGEIQKGILDFVNDYLSAFKDFPYMLNISGRDAYAPILLASSNNEKYLKEIAKKFKLEKNVV